MSKKRFKQIYREVVKGRATSTVRIVNSIETKSLNHSPIFLIGLFRSGTTLLRYIIDSHSNICCPPESDFIGFLPSIANEKLSKSGLESMGFDEAHVIQRLQDFTLYFFENYATAHGKSRWADKSPSYVDHLDFLLKLFPNARFIMIYRHGLDQAHSHTHGGTFLHWPLEDYCYLNEDLRIGAVRYWSEKTAKMMAFEKHHPENCIRIFYEKLCAEPEKELRPIFEFVDEPWESQVIEFHKFSHDKGREDSKIRDTKGFSISSQHYLNWSSRLREECMTIAEPIMQRLDYSV